MAYLSFLRLLAFAVSLSLFGFASPLHANDDPLKEAKLEAHDLLIKAHDEKDAAQRASDLEQAKVTLQHSAPGPLSHHRKKAVEQINAALYQLKQGDPKDLVNRYIDDANRELGF